MAPLLSSLLCLALGGVTIWWQSPTIDEWGYLQIGTKSWLGGNLGPGGNSQQLVSKLGVLPLPFWVQCLPGSLYLWARYGGVPGGLAIDLGRDLAIHDQFLLLHSMRWTNLLLAGVGTIWALWWLTRREFGGHAASLAAFFAAIEPNLLASASLGTADATALPPTLLALGYFIDYRRLPSGWKLAATGVLLGVGIALKVSMLIHGLLLLVIVAMVTRLKSNPAEETRAPRPVRWVWRLAAQLVAITAIAVAVSWGLSGFLTDAVVNPTSSNEMAGRLLAKLGLQRDEAQIWIGRLRRLQIPAPLAVLRWQVGHGFSGHEMSFRGVAGTSGPWYYYPYVFAMKSHLILLAVTLAAAALPRVRRSPLFWSVLALLAFSCTVKLHGGPRYFLLMFALCCSLGGATVVTLLAHVPSRLARAALVGVLALSSLALTANSLPNLLSHTSPLWGGDREGYRYADANYDWGQGLYHARAEARRRGLEPIRFLHFGDPFYGVDEPGLILPQTSIAEMLPQMRGHYVAVSAFWLYLSGRAIPSERLPLYEALARLGHDGRLTNTYFYFDFRDPARLAALESLLAEPESRPPVADPTPAEEPSGNPT